jgi:hypothetical protein
MLFNTPTSIKKRKFRCWNLGEVGRNKPKSIDMACDMSEVYKVSMVSMPNKADELKKFKGLDKTVWKHAGC